MSHISPLTGVNVVEYASSVSAAYAGRLLASMGANTILVEPPNGSQLRREPPFFDQEPGLSALFAYLAAGKKSVVCDVSQAADRSAFDALLSQAQILIVDAPMSDRADLGLDRDQIKSKFPDLVYVSVLPFGAVGEKSDWRGQEINLIHSGGEGFLLPNGLSIDMFPERPPLKMGGHFAEMQGGIAAAFGALAALLSGKGQFVDTSIQDANVAVGAFAIQRHGDGSVEHRTQRSFRYGGVIECQDGFVELLTLEDRQWDGLIELMGKPEWANDSSLSNAVERSARGSEINGYIRAWARTRQVSELVAQAQDLGVPVAPYNTPVDVLEDPHEKERGLFDMIDLSSLGPTAMLTAPFRFEAMPVSIQAGPPELGADQDILDACLENENKARAGVKL